MTSQQAPLVDDVLADLVSVLNTVAGADEQTVVGYDEVRESTSGQLELHLLSYIRFLESSELLEYDRDADRMSVTARGETVRMSPHDIREDVAEAFKAQVRTEADAQLGDELGDELDGMFHEMESAVDDAISEQSDSGGDGNTRGEVASTSRESKTESNTKSKNHELATPSGEPEDQTERVGEGEAMKQDAFERIDELGSGGIGTVYRGRQIRLNREVAIKEIGELFNVFAGIDRADVVQRFQSIVETQASLHHPNIIEIFDIDTTAEFPFSVMELAPRGNLRRLIDTDERPDLNVVLQYFLQVLHALNTAHRQGIVHGNLKPENVVLDTSGNALVTDFRLSDIIDSQAGSKNQVYVGVGSVAYMSPEQLKDPNLVTEKSDMYSLGIMFYEMLTGEVPGRRSPMPSEIFEDIPTVLDDIFDRMSMDDETERYDSVEEIIDELYGADPVVDILDDRSGVLFLADPSGETALEEVGAAVVLAAKSPEEAQEEEPQDAGESADSEEEESAPEEDSEEEALDESSDTEDEAEEAADVAADADTDDTDEEASDDAETEEEEEEEEETSDDAESEEDEEDEEEASDDAESEEEEEEASDDDDSEGEGEEADNEDGEAEEDEDKGDEVLDKLDEYGEMFE